MIRGNKRTAYTIEQILRNEEGWLFYDSAWKTFKAIQNKIIGNSVLDIGCGGGVSLCLLKVFRPKLRLTGFEGSSASRRIWKERNLDVFSGDIENLPFEDNSFDTVFSSHVLEHLEHPSNLVRESLRVAKQRVIHAVPTGDVGDKNLGSPHLHIFNRYSFREIMECTAFKVAEIENVEDVHMSSLIGIINKHEY